MSYPKGIIKSSDVIDTVEFDKRDLIMTGELSRLMLRSSGNFSGIGFYLNSGVYKWQIITDNKGELVLVPTKRSD